MSSPVGETCGKFDQDFRDGAVRIAREPGKPIARVARELGVNEATLGNWVMEGPEAAGGQGRHEKVAGTGIASS